MASAITIPDAPANPCTKRSMVSTATLGAMIQSSDASAKTAIPMSRGRRRPRASLMGPAIIWPSDRPRIQAVKVICASDIVADRWWLTVGREGKYISVDSGPNAVSPPRMSTWRARTRVDVSLLSFTVCLVPSAEGESVACWLLWRFDEKFLVDMVFPLFFLVSSHGRNAVLT